MGVSSRRQTCAQAGKKVTPEGLTADVMRSAQAGKEEDNCPLPINHTKQRLRGRLVDKNHKDKGSMAMQGKSCMKRYIISGERNVMSKESFAFIRNVIRSQTPALLRSNPEIRLRVINTATQSSM